MCGQVTPARIILSAITIKMTQLYFRGSFSLLFMCTNMHYVINRYSGQKIYVKCGKCNACKQEKADRLTSRLNNHSTDSERVAIFCSLSYDERFVPYVLRKDLENKDCYELPIYRDFTVRRFQDHFVIRDCSNSPVLLDKISLLNKDTGEINREGIFFHGNLWKKGRGYRQDRVGVIYYHDYQNFQKRLRIYLQRKYCKGFGNIEFFGTGEYGETHFRNHFHVLVFCDKNTFVRVKAAICDCWPFASRDDLERSTKLAFNAAAYVSSYVNSSSDIPVCFAHIAKTKHSFSRSVGVKMPDFGLLSILEKVNRGTLSYSKATKYNGVPTVFDVPIPKYVINRYFPLFKGLCRLDVHTLACLLRFPYTYFRFKKHECLTDYEKGGNPDCWRNYIRLSNSRDKYLFLTGKTIYDYAIDYLRTWNCYKNTLYKLSFEQDIPMNERYDNIVELFNGSIRNDSLSHYLGNFDGLPDDANNFSTVRRSTERSSSRFWLKQKHSKENNFIRTNFQNKNL